MRIKHKTQQKKLKKWLNTHEESHRNKTNTHKNKTQT